MSRRFAAAALCVAWMVSVAASSAAAQGFRFPEGRHGKGELRYINGVPVLILVGTPEEIGEQMGVLALKPARGAMAVYNRFLESQGLSNFRGLLVRLGESLLKKYPAEYRRELDAAAKASGFDRELLILGNTFHDIRKLHTCSAVMVSPDKSQTGGTLLGRNLDYPLVRGMHQYSLVTVYCPEGKQPFAVVSFPGALVTGCAMSGMNSAGLFIGQNDVGPAADQSPHLVLENTPTAVLARRVLEDCRTIEQVEKLMQKNKPAGRSIFVLCDREGGGVIESTPKTVVLREGQNGLCAATNHFESRQLSVGNTCVRLDKLTRAQGLNGKLDVNDTFRLLQAVSQDWWTAHSLVFEPETLKLHIAFGDGYRPATAFPLRTVDLSPWLKPEQSAPGE